MTRQSKTTKAAHAPDSWEESDWRNGKYYAQESGTIAGNSNEYPTVGPSGTDMSSDPGEIWELNYTLTFANEIGPVVFKFRDWNYNVIEKAVLDSYQGNMIELTTIVESSQMADGEGVRERIENNDSDSSDYLLTCNGTRLRKATDTQALVNGESF